MADDGQAQTTLREVIEQNVEAAEAGTLPGPEERARDEAGRFAKKESAPADDAATLASAAAQPQSVHPVAQQEAQPAIAQRPTTWKKEYLPLYDKLATGQPLTPEEAKKLADYSNQRENEYKSGVSTYKAEAMQARELQEAIAPFMPEIQAHGLQPAAWVRDLGQAHYVLVKGSPEQKVQLFQVLAQRYGVPLAAVTQAQQGGGVPPIVAQLMQQISDLKTQIGDVNGWRNNLQVQQLQSEVQRAAGDKQTYPHFEAVREQMAQLLERGAAPDLPTAYKMAIRLNDDIHSEEVDRLLAEKLAAKASAVTQARSKAISPKSATPSGSAASAGPKDRRAMLAEQLDAAASGGRV